MQFRYVFGLVFVAAEVRRSRLLSFFVRVAVDLIGSCHSRSNCYLFLVVGLLRSRTRMFAIESSIIYELVALLFTGWC
jgi:hypothetical protein